MLLFDIIADILRKYSHYQEICLNCGSIPAKNFLLEELNTLILKYYPMAYYYSDLSNTYIFLPKQAIDQLYYVCFSTYPEIRKPSSPSASITLNIAHLIGKKLPVGIFQNPIAACLVQQSKIAKLEQENQALQDKIAALEAQLQAVAIQPLASNSYYSPSFFNLVTPANSQPVNNKIDLTQDVTYSLPGNQY